MPRAGKKTGRLSRQDLDYIKEHRNIPPDSVALHINRSRDSVLKAALADLPPLDQPIAPEPELRSTIRLSLTQSAAWKQLLAELFPDEVRYAEEQYISLLEQFKDVLATEESQIFKAIRLEILKHRNAVKQKLLSRKITDGEREYDRLMKYGDELADKDRDRLTVISNGLVILSDSQSTLASEYVKLEEKHQKLMEALKATRQQRIDRIETGKTSFLDIIKDMTLEETREREGRQAALMKRAADKELKRLGTPYTYGDGVLDQPVLSAETLQLLDIGVVSVQEKKKEHRDS